MITSNAHVRQRTVKQWEWMKERKPVQRFRESRQVAKAGDPQAMCSQTPVAECPSLP